LLSEKPLQGSHDMKVLDKNIHSSHKLDPAMFQHDGFSLLVKEQAMYGNTFQLIKNGIQNPI